MLPETFEIAGYAIQPCASLVRGPDGERRLEPKVMAVLELLVEHAGQVVAKSDFMDRVWPDACVGDDALVRCISQIRKVFDGARTEVIETVPKKGYRLVASIQGREHHPQTTALTLEAVLGMSTDQIYVYDREGRYLYVSQAGSRALGFAPREMINKTWRELGMPASVMEPFQRRVAEVFERTGFVRDTVRYSALFGPREFEYVLEPIMAGCKVVAVIALVRDVTEVWFEDQAI